MGIVGEVLRELLEPDADVGPCPQSTNGKHNWNHDGFDTKQCLSCNVRVNDNVVIRQVIWPRDHRSV